MPKLYLISSNSACRSVLMAIRAADIKGVDLVELKKDDLSKPEYRKMNPKGGVPTLDDDGLYLWESQPIMTYLLQKYGKCGDLFPKCTKRRSLVDRLLFFDLGIVHKAVVEYTYSLVFDSRASDDQEDVLKKALRNVDDVISNNTWATGDNFTVADCALLATITTLDLKDWDYSAWTNVDRFIRAGKALPFFKECNNALYEMRAKLTQCNREEFKSEHDFNCL